MQIRLGLKRRKAFGKGVGSGMLIEVLKAQEMDFFTDNYIGNSAIEDYKYSLRSMTGAT